MKQFKYFAFVGAMMLAMVAGFSSCKNNGEAEISGDPNLNGEVVKTEFSIALPSQVVNGRRMPSETVQIDPSEFNGIGGIYLVPFADGAQVTSSSTRLGQNISLGDITTTDVSLADAEAKKAKTYSNVEIPLTTSAFLFYGESKKTGDNDQKGSLTGVFTADSPQDFKFSLSPIQSSIAGVTSDGAGKSLIDLLNSVATAGKNTTTNTKGWYEDDTNDGMTAMFATFSTFKNLSSHNVQVAMTDLYKSMKPLSNRVAEAIKDTLNLAKYASVDGEGQVTLASGLTDFPNSKKLPDGAVAVKWATNKFVAAAETDYTTANRIPLDKYVYPSSLWYYVNSLISTSNSSKSELYASGKKWDDIIAAHEAAKSVNTLTRAVAIDKPVQYGVARLDVLVRQASNALEDNNGETITHTGYPVSAVLIGSQQNVGFDFTPISTEPVYTIYDRVMTNALTTSTDDFNSDSKSNSTLVLETLADGDNKDVQIAIELTNNSGVAFAGVDGLIPAGGKFYLIGKLEASSASTTDKQVFIKDYTTTAKLTIGSLKKAYNTIPDLRTPKLEIGLSVDLNWTAGSNYDVVL